MTVMRHTFHYPDGTPVVGAPVEIFLIAPGGRETTGYIGGVQVVSRWKGATDDNGRIGVNGDGVDLPVVDAPNPAVWTIRCMAPGSHIIPDSYFTVPDEGPAEVNDNLAAPPNQASWSIIGITPQLTQLALAANPDSIIVGDITRDDNGAALSAGVVWPDGTTGEYEATVVSLDFPGAVDAYTVTYGTTTYTQPEVTRDDNGAVINRPAIEVS